MQDLCLSIQIKHLSIDIIKIYQGKPLMQPNRHNMSRIQDRATTFVQNNNNNNNNNNKYHMQNPPNTKGRNMSTNWINKKMVTIINTSGMKPNQ